MCLYPSGLQKEAAEKVRIADHMTLLMKAQDEERRRIARELHDSAGQTLTVLGLSLAHLVERAQVIAPELAKEGKEIEGVVQQLQREIRTTSYLLHPPLLDECGLASALNMYVEGLAERSHTAITLDVADNVGRLPARSRTGHRRFGEKAGPEAKIWRSHAECMAKLDLTFVHELVVFNNYREK